MTMQTMTLEPGSSYCCYFSAANGLSCFIDDDCYEFYLRRLEALCNRLSLRLHAYCLLEHEVFLLITPMTPRALKFCIDSVSRSYGEYFKQRFNRPSLVFPKFRCATRIGSDAAFLDCQKYLEIEGMHKLNLCHPGAYHWSSYTQHAFGGTSRSEFARGQRARQRMMRNSSGKFANKCDSLVTSLNRQLVDRPLATLDSHSASARYLQSGPDRLRDYRAFIAKGFSGAYHAYLQVKLRHGAYLGPLKKNSSAAA